MESNRSERSLVHDLLSNDQLKMLQTPNAMLKIKINECNGEQSEHGCIVQVGKAPKARYVKNTVLLEQTHKYYTVDKEPEGSEIACISSFQLQPMHSGMQISFFA